MAYTEGLKIFKRTYELIKLIYKYVITFPKSQRFVLGQRLENTAINLIENIIIANNQREKTPVLNRASIELDKLRVFIRLAKDLKFLDFKKYKILSEMTNEIGKMLGGWIKYCKGK